MRRPSKKSTARFIADFRKSHLMDRITVKLMGPISKLIARTGVSVPAQASLGAGGLQEVRHLGADHLLGHDRRHADQKLGGVGYTDYTYASARKGSDESVLKYQQRRYACQSCPLGCGASSTSRRAASRGKPATSPNTKPWGAFGGLLLHDDLDAIIELNEMCNRAGIDTISTGGVIAFAIECFETD